MTKVRYIVLAIAVAVSLYARAQGAQAQPEKPSIYQGMTLKLDIGSTAIVLGASRGQIQHYELAMNWRLKNRFYPTFEGGYAGGANTYDSVAYAGQGGFFRVGCDINPLKKHPESPHAMLIGIRLGTAVQQFAQDVTKSEISPLSTETGLMMNVTGVRADCWGEIVGGCQVEIAKVGNTAFYMGWMARFRALFTRTLTPEVKATLSEDTTDHSPYMPYYIPGYGKRDNIGWGLSYHLAWRF